MAYFRHTQQTALDISMDLRDSWALTVSIKANHHPEPFWFFKPWSVLHRSGLWIFFLDPVDGRPG